MEKENQELILTYYIISQDKYNNRMQSNITQKGGRSEKLCNILYLDSPNCSFVSQQKKIHIDWRFITLAIVWHGKSFWSIGGFIIRIVI